MSWDEYAAGWDEDEAVRAYAEAAHGSLQKVMADYGLSIEGARALDFGCGTGLLTEKLAARCKSVVAQDTSKAMLERLRQKIDRGGLTNVETVGEPLEAAKAQGGALGAPFDLVVCSSVCGFLEDYPGTIVTLASLLRDGGLFIQWDWELDPSAEEPYGLTRDQIGEALEGAGLGSVRVETAFEVALGEATMRPLLGAGVRA